MENYFNYFTEIEECFRRSRGTPSLLSTLDWALIEAWKEAGIPLEAALTGVERSFEKFAKRPNRYRKINGLAYCSQEVLRAADEIRAAEGAGAAPTARNADAEPPFPPEMVASFLGRNTKALESAARAANNEGQAILAGDLADCARSLGEISAQQAAAPANDFEDLERRLTALEEKATAALTRASSVELLTDFRQEVERELRVDRRRMTASQIEALERQYLKKRLFEHYRVPRLSLFYL